MSTCTDTTEISREIRYVLDTRVATLEARLARAVEVLQIIAGQKQCVDNLMSDKDLARSFLEENT